MKALKINLAILLIMVVLISCSKDGKSPDNTAATPLVKETIITYPTIRVVFDNTYDDQKRLIRAGINSGTITYNTNGFKISFTRDDGTKSITDVTLVNGRISKVISSDSDIEKYNSTFSYDDRGRLIKIAQIRTYNGEAIYHLAYTYSWGDDDNLVNSLVITDAGSYSISYSGFSADNVNTLSGKNYGFNYFGTTDFPSDYVPNVSGGSGFIFPSVYAGKLLPSVIKKSGHTYNVTYHKNGQGFIDKITQVNQDNADDSIITDVSYQ